MTACNADGGYYRLENSHGKRKGNDGHLYATAAWLEANLFEVVVPLQCAPAYEPGEVVEMPYYDAMAKKM